MSETHDPVSQSNYLRQCLAHDRRPLGLFIGAGCPMAIRVQVDGQDGPLIPDIAGMTKRVFDALKASEQKGPFEIISSHFKKDGLPSPNIEHLLSHIRALRQVAGKESVRGLSAQALDNLEKAICDELVSLCDRNLPNSDTPFHSLAAWIAAIERVEPVQVFTTNYDLLIEEALESNRVPYFDGFVGSRKTFLDLQSMEDDKLPSRWCRLWKIHGSLNWFEDESGSVHRGTPEGMPRVIYPSYLKHDESQRMPYLAMIDRLRASLKKEGSVLTFCGYSFTDEHLNEILVQCLQGNSTAIAFALLFGNIQDFPKIVTIAQTRQNLNVLARDGAVIGARNLTWTKGRDATDCEDSIAVKWITDPAQPKLRNASFELGGFADFAGFAADLIGEQQRSGRT